MNSFSGDHIQDQVKYNKVDLLKESRFNIF